MKTKAFLYLCSILVVIYFSAKMFNNQLQKKQPMEKDTVAIDDFSVPTKDVLLVRKITAETADILKNEVNLRLVGVGSAMMDEIKMLAMSFDYYQEVEVEKARELLVIAIREYLQAINANEEIRPYLKQYPFTAKEVEIFIIIRTPAGQQPDLGKVCCFGSYDGNLGYYRREERYGLPPPFLKECYEDALRIVEEQKKK